MRIAGGRKRGLRLEAPPGTAVRPTSDRARQALFNLLAHGRPAAPGSGLRPARGQAPGFRLDGAVVLDAFAGTGALGLEALSRGAARAVFIENGRDVLPVLRRNIAAFGKDADATVIEGDATRPPAAREAAGLVLADPPYGEGLAGPALAALAGAGWIADGAVCCVETGAREAFDPPEGFEALDDRRYGAARIVVLRY